MPGLRLPSLATRPMTSTAGEASKRAVAASKVLNARLLIVSAGVGLIDASTEIPPYACTILNDSPESIGNRVAGGVAPANWWKEMTAASSFAMTVGSTLASSIGLICAALSDVYMALVADDLIALPVAHLQRLRLFTRAPAAPHLGTASAFRHALW